MRKAILFTVKIFLVAASFAQKQTFDVISFTVPKGWQQQKGEAGIQLSVTDKKTGAYAVAVITKATPSSASANENFNNDWGKLVKGTVQVNDAPAMQEPSQGNGWEIISGNANFTEGNNKGLVTLITATSNVQTVSVVLMTNTSQYQNELLAFINSLQLEKAETTKTESAQSNNISLTGKIWQGITSEKFTAGGLKGHYTGGFFSQQYVFNADGTYKFINVLASAYLQTNSLQYETGTYAVKGNQLTINPVSGANEEWSVTGGPVKLAAMSDVQIRKIKESWGKRISSAKRKLEKVTYTFRIEYMTGNNSNALVLEGYNGHTEREGNGNVTYYFETAAPSSIKNPIILLP